MDTAAFNQVNTVCYYNKQTNILYFGLAVFPNLEGELFRMPLVATLSCCQRGATIWSCDNIC